MDTVRADHLEAYGYSRPTMPRLAQLARRSWVFRRAFTQETNTGPAHASMFTALYPPQHGEIENGVPLPAGSTTLAEILRSEGWATAAFVSGWPMRAATSGLDRGFDLYDDAFEDERRAGDVTTERAIDWWRSARSHRRFLFLHLYDAHGPYKPRADFAKLFQSASPGRRVQGLPAYQRARQPFGERAPLVGEQEYIDAYDASIRTLDDLIGRVLSEVDLDRTVVAITSDHGESLNERFHKFDHGHQVFDEQTHVPLVISAPHLGSRSVDQIVELVDLLPTLLDLVGARSAPPRDSKGHDLADLVLRGQGRPAVAFSSARAVPKRIADRNYDIDRERRLVAVRTEDSKLIFYPGHRADYIELFDLKNDAGEARPLSLSEPPGPLEPLRSLLLRYSGQFQRRKAPIRHRSEDIDKLRALGYLD
jgi:arylsulfatase